MAWTNHMMDRLKELVAGRKHSGSEIAAIISREFSRPLTRNSIAGQVHKLGLKLEANKDGRHPPWRHKTFRSRPLPDVSAEAPEEAFPPVIVADVPPAETVSRYSLTVEDSRISRNNNPWKPPVEPGIAAKRDLPVEQARRPVTLLRLTEKTCRWPVRTDPSYLFCGEKPIAGCPYCPRHFQRSTVGVPSRRGGHFAMSRV